MSTTQDYDLKPCPFCGGPVQLINRQDGKFLRGAYVLCDACGITTTIKETAAEAIEAWNVRALPSPPTKGEHQ